jgi:hypothetical protein
MITSLPTARHDALQAQLYLVCKAELGRSPSPRELGAWRRLVDEGMPVAQLRTRISRTPEARLNALYASEAEGDLPPDLRCDCLNRLGKGLDLEAVAYYLLGRLDERRTRQQAA